MATRTQDKDQFLQSAEDGIPPQDTGEQNGVQESLMNDHSEPKTAEQSSTNELINLSEPLLPTNLSTTVNASILSASELPTVGDKTLEEIPVQTPVDHEVQPEETNAEQMTDNEWMDILGNGQIMKRVIRKGAGISTRPTPQSRVKVSTKGLLESGDIVDKHSACVFTVGDGDVIQAWDLAITLMEKGEVSEVKTDSRFAYGDIGRSPDIPPKATITYQLELLDVLEPINYQTVTEDDIIAAVDKKRVRGNELFQRHDYDRAVNSYQRGLQMLKSFTEEQGGGDRSRIQDMQIRCWNNVAAAQLKVERSKDVLESCGHVLEKDPDNVKALFRSGKVLSQGGEMDEAIRRLQRASTLNPEEKAIKLELQRATHRREQMLQKEKAMYKRMVEGKPPIKTTKTKQKHEGSSLGPIPYLTAAVVVATIGIGIAYLVTQRH